MGGKSRRQKAGLLNANKDKKILYLVYPGYEEWMKSKQTDIAVKQSGAKTVMKMDCATIEDIVTYLEEQKSKSVMYDVLVFVPGHGCYPRRDVMKTVKDDNGKRRKVTVSESAPVGMVWHQDPLVKDPPYYLVDKAMKTVVNLCLDICVHLHLATCHQGCSLHRYEDLVNKTRKKKRFIISGWTMALFQEATHNRDDLLHYLSRGCPHFSYRHRHNIKYFTYYDSHSAQCATINRKCV